MNDPDSTPRPSLISRVQAFAMRQWDYITRGVWHDPRHSFKVTAAKVLNISIRSFMSTDLQVRAASLTYNTVLAIVPMLALVFAIGRGFGFQNLMQTQLLNYFPAQRQAITTALSFAERYTAQSSEGLFVGIGIVFLLWTLISLLGNVEDSFNKIWSIRSGRTIWRKITDYLAILLVLPVLMICGSGLSIFMSTIAHMPIFGSITPALEVLLDGLSYVFTWLFFTGVYMLIPNTKVKFTNALMAGVLAGFAFQVLQWLFVSGQLYVSKYNAIYGSFSFLPLLLIWLQLVWLITLAGALVCYASQNVFELSFIGDVEGISPVYRRKVTIAVVAIVCKRFARRLRPLSAIEIAREFQLPAHLVGDILVRMEGIGIISRLATADDSESPVQPAVPVESLTVGEVWEKSQAYGSSHFIPGFKKRFKGVVDVSDNMDKVTEQHGDKILVIDIDIDVTCPLDKTAPKNPDNNSDNPN